MCVNIEIRFALPVVTRFLCPPEIPLNIAFPTKVLAQVSSPKICKCIANKQERKDFKKDNKNDYRIHMVFETIN